VNAPSAAARPEQIPNLANGRRLWMADCALCHGLEARATARRRRTWSRRRPRSAANSRALAAQVYNAVSLGVGGTAMPSFANAYTPQQRWDVAFYAMTLRIGFDPKRRRPARRSARGRRLVVERDAARAAPPHGARRVAGAGRLVPREPRVAAGGDGADGGPGSAATGGLALAMQMQDAFASVAERCSRASSASRAG
jgi:mono/diheme cytochrome c family protein